MPDVVLPPKSKRQIPGLLVLILVFTITLASVIANTALRRSINESEQTANSLLRLQGLAYRLSALEWQSIATVQMSSEIIENTQNTQDEMYQIAGELEQFDPNSENLQMVRQAFTTYISAVTEEFKLIEAGDLEQARLVDEEQVDPAFNVFEQALTTTSAAYSAKATRMKQAGDLGSVLVLFFNAVLIALVLWRFQKTQQSIEREYLHELKTVNMELEANQKNLEQHVTERTAELDFANRNNERRARQFEAISQVVRVVSSIQDLELLIPRIAQVISEQFGFYHTGIFLLDEEREYAVLRAANSAGGKKMLGRAHKLQVGQIGIVGFVTATGQPRIALDVGSDAVFFDNPDLPDTRSEIALPLRYAGQIIGALDVQSTESNAFGQNDVETLTTLADQISIAINNTAILDQARKAFVESQSRFGNTVLESWKVMQPESMKLGYQLVNASIKPLEKPLEGSYIQEAIDQERSILSNLDDRSSNLAIPIRLRGKVIGIMNLRSRNNYILTRDDADIAEAVSERLSLAIETATLLRTTQYRADIERVTADISSKISSSTHFEAILQITAQELSKALGGSDVLVQIEPISMELGMSG